MNSTQAKAQEFCFNVIHQNDNNGQIFRNQYTFTVNNENASKRIDLLKSGEKGDFAFPATDVLDGDRIKFEGNGSFTASTLGRYRYYCNYFDRFLVIKKLPPLAELVKPENHQLLERILTENIQSKTIHERTAAAIQQQYGIRLNRKRGRPKNKLASSRPSAPRYGEMRNSSFYKNSLLDQLCKNELLISEQHKQILLQRAIEEPEAASKLCFGR